MLALQLTSIFDLVQTNCALVLLQLAQLLQPLSPTSTLNALRTPVLRLCELRRVEGEDRDVGLGSMCKRTIFKCELVIVGGRAAFMSVAAVRLLGELPIEESVHFVGCDFLGEIVGEFVFEGYFAPHFELQQYLIQQFGSIQNHQRRRMCMDQEDRAKQIRCYEYISLNQLKVEERFLCDRQHAVV